MSEAKVDTRLMERQRVEQFLGLLNKKEMSVNEMERLGEQLIKMGPLVGPVLLKKVADCREDTLMARYLFMLEYLDDDRLVSPLIEILLSGEGEESLKARILSTLRYFDVPVSGPMFLRLFSDCLRPSSDRAGRFVSLLEENELLLSLFLEGFDNLPAGVRISTVKEMGRYQGPRALFLLDLLAEGNDKEVALAAIEAIGRVRSVKAARILDRIVRRGLRPHLSEVAGRARRRLSFLGVRETRSGPLVALEGTIHRCHASGIDPEGSSYLWVARKWRSDPKWVESVCLILNDEGGLVDCTGSTSGPLEEYDAMIRRLGNEEYVVEVGYDYALALIKDALVINERNGYSLPSEFSFRTKIFLDDDLSQVTYEPLFPGYNLGEISRDRRLYLKTGELLAWREFAGWAFSGEAVYDLAEELFRLEQGGCPEAIEKGRLAIYRRFYQEVVVSRLPILKRRLLLMADLMARAGAGHSKVKLVLSAALNLEQEPSIFRCHPLIRRLMAASLNAAKKAVACGEYQGWEEEGDI